jgi:hypothetical protein
MLYNSLIASFRSEGRLDAGYETQRFLISGDLLACDGAQLSSYENKKASLYFARCPLRELSHPDGAFKPQLESAAR